MEAPHFKDVTFLKRIAPWRLAQRALGLAVLPGLLFSAAEAIE
jgi:hypothetical protein